MPPTVTTLLGCLTLVVTATVFAGLLRWARCPGASVLGGLAAGLLLGVSVGGRTWPGLHETVWSGGVEPRQARDTLLRRHGAELAGAEHVGMGPDAHAEIRERHHAERGVADAAWDAARWDHSAPIRVAVLILVASMLVSGATGSPPRSDGRGMDAGTVLSMGGWAAAVPGATVFVVFDRVLGFDLASSLLSAAAVAAGPLTLTAIDRRAADDAELGGARLVQRAGRVMSIIAVGLVITTLALTRGWHAGPPAAAIAAVVLGWLAPPAWERAGSRGVELVLLPAVAALAILPMDLTEDAALWPIVVALLVSGDGRWCGATLGGMLTGGRTWLRTMRLVMGVMAAAPMQLAIVAVGLHWRLLPAEVGLAIVLGALLLDTAPSMRRWMAARLAELEAEGEGSD